DQVGGDHVGAAAGADDGRRQVFPKVLQRDAAGGHDLEHGEGGAHGLDLGQAAGLLGGEELEDLQAQLVGGVIVGGGGAAGEHGHALGLAVLDDVHVQAGGDDELGAGGQGLIHLSGGEDGARAHQHIGAG